MFTDILEKNELERICLTYNLEGIESINSRLTLITGKLLRQHYLSEQDLNLDTTVLNFFKLMKQQKKLQSGYSEILDFDKWLNENFRNQEIINFSNNALGIGEDLAGEIRKIKERITVVLQLYAGIGALLMAIIAISISVIL